MRGFEFNCEVRWATLGSVEPAHLQLLDPVERERRARYLRAEDQERFTLGVALTRQMLAERSGEDPARIALDRTCDCGQPHGRPRSPIAHISVSHSGTQVGVAVADVPVGLDVETGTKGMAGLADHILAPDEAPGDLLVYWTRKEALLKSTGDGLRVPMTDLTVSAPDQPARLIAWKGREDLRIDLHDLEAAPGHAAALALIPPRR